MNGPPRFGIVAGEPSGDLLGAALIEALRGRFPDARFSGVGGPGMIRQGCRSLVPMDRLSVMGFAEPLGRLPELLRIRRLLLDHFLRERPAAFVGIDSPDFNLRLAGPLKARGVPAVHYVSPSVWAWRRGRIRGIRRSVDLMLTLFPFETAVYEEHRVPARWVGHPLADRIGFEDRRGECRARLALAADEPVAALLPGSRDGEIRRLAPVFLDAALDAQRRVPALRFLIPVGGTGRERLSVLLRGRGLEGDGRFRLTDDSHAAMAAADFVLTAGGTAALEAMLLRRPMAVCYRLAPLTYALASRLVDLRWFSLPNLLAGRALVPEYLQRAVTVPALSGELVRFFEERPSREALLAEFDRLHRLLRRDASRAAAAAVAELVREAGRAD